MNGWLNLYKPKGISSAKAVGFVKRMSGEAKVGHCGTLDLEAEGVLPLAIGEATKLVSILMNNRKKYIFTMRFGAKTDTADSAGIVVSTTKNIPNEKDCVDICANFIGTIAQTPPAFSALKVNGVRAYKLARERKQLVQLKKRDIIVYDLKCLGFNQVKSEATYIAECSKGTYIRTLAEDIALSLQSLAFVVELRRVQVGIFDLNNVVHINDFECVQQDQIADFFAKKMLRVEEVLNDISVLDANLEQFKKIKHGQNCYFYNSPDVDCVWIRYSGAIIAIGALSNSRFNSARVFNLI